MSLREWLFAIGTLFIIVIVIDGVRRMRRARKESMAISSGMGANDLDESPLEDEYNPELPNGGARSISRDVLEERGYVKTDRKSRFANPEPKPTRPIISSSGKDEAPEAEVDLEPPQNNVEPSDQRSDEEVVPDVGWGARDEVPPTVTTEVEEDTARRKPVDHSEQQPLAGANRPEAREVIVINVLAPSGENFKGNSLKSLFEACGLEYGDMDIYHRHEQSDTTSPVQFSVASAVEPGTFRPGDMPGLSTPGISFFMSLPGPTNALQAFDFMLETAQCVVRNMGGELKDERRSVMTPQTIEHCRQRIREFERKQRSPRH